MAEHHDLDIFSGVRGGPSRPEPMRDSAQAADAQIGDEPVVGLQTARHPRTGAPKASTPRATPQ